MSVIVLYYLWSAVYKSSPTPVINGFTFEEMVRYVFYTPITVLIASNEIEYDVASDVREGTIAMQLIKPISYKLKLLFEDLGHVGFRSITCALPIFIGFSIYDGLHNGQPLPSLGHRLLFIVSCVLSYGIQYFINFSFGLAAFFVTYIWGFAYVKGVIIRFFSGQLIPLNFFPGWAIAGMAFLPFGAMVYTPTMILLGKFTIGESLNGIGLQLIWLVILGLANGWLFKIATKRLTIMGG